MQLLTNMELPILPADLPEFAADPVPFVEEARQQHPWLAKSNVGGYIVHGYHAARDIIGMDDNTHPFYPGIAKFYDAEGTPWGDFISGMMNATVGDKHRRLRVSAQSAFTPKEGLHLIARRLRHPRLAGKVTWRPYMGIWGVQSLPIEFDPTPAREVASA